VLEHDSVAAGKGEKEECTATAMAMELSGWLTKCSVPLMHVSLTALNLIRTAQCTFRSAFLGTGLWTSKRQPAHVYFVIVKDSNDDVHSTKSTRLKYMEMSLKKKTTATDRFLLLGLGNLSFPFE
jgi:hypothetical protein